MMAIGRVALLRAPCTIELAPEGEPQPPKFDLAACTDLPAPEPAPMLELPAPALDAPDLASELGADAGDDDTADDEPPPTPLEQAVLDVLDRAPLLERRELPAELVAPVPEARDHGPRMTPAAPVREPRAVPEQASPTSHVNLVLDDGDRRLVVTVAVRGSDVNVALRASDDATTAALARNAATLDHALHARGLSLAELSTGREPERERHHDRPRRDRKETARFGLEETP